MIGFTECPVGLGFRSLRESLCRSVSDVAELTDGLSHIEVEAFESGRLELDGDRLARACLAAGFQVSDLYAFCNDVSSHGEKMVEGLTERARKLIEGHAVVSTEDDDGEYAVPAFGERLGTSRCQIHATRSSVDVYEVVALHAGAEHRLPTTKRDLLHLKESIVELVE